MLVAIGFYSAWLFSLGHYWTGVLGGFLSLAASVLDGCDGEIARLKYQESALGCWIETFGDYSYYSRSSSGSRSAPCGRPGGRSSTGSARIALAGTLLTFGLLIYLRSRITAGQPERLHAIARSGSRPSRHGGRASSGGSRSSPRGQPCPTASWPSPWSTLLPGIVVLAAIGANIYWVSLVLKLRHLLGDEEAIAA